MKLDQGINRSAFAWVKRSVLMAFVSALALFPAAAQLAITEVMSDASVTGVRRDDFWELTNFGTNSIPLTNYWFRDEGGVGSAANLGTLWKGTRTDEAIIGPYESILFVRPVTDVLATPSDFRQWWGDLQLLPDQKVIFYTGFGFNSLEDAVQLWQVTPERTILVHRVELFEALTGSTFTYNPLTGLLDTFSTAGVDGAFVAAATDDVGSPGFTTGPVSLSVVTGPVGTQVDAGVPFTFTVKAHGLPVPQYQWYFNGDLIPGATASTFTLPAVRGSDAGQYSVALDNGLERIVSTSATITVNTRLSCARIVTPPADIEVTPGQTAYFRVETRGYPLPTIQWRFNGVAIPGATSGTYAVEDADESRIGIYTVHIANALCSADASARLNVVPVPHLIVTEAMNFPTNRTALKHDTWWELTNADTNAVNLRGYRWDDYPPSLERVTTVTNDLILAPGKSVIFVSTMSPDAFRRWWGEENLPAGLPIISHPGNGLSTSIDGEVIYLFNATAISTNDWICFRDFVAFEPGVSLWFDPVLAEYGEPSIDGQGGAFAAAEGGDIGSPGWTSNEQRVVRPRVTRIQRNPASVTVTWKSQPGRTYELRRSSTPGGTNWALVLRLPATGNSLSATDTTTSGAVQRFYQVTLVP